MMRTETDVIEFEAPTWDGLDAALAFAQGGVKTDGAVMSPREVGELLTIVRGDLAVLRVAERVQRGAPVVTHFLEAALPAAVAPAAAAPAAPRGAGLTPRDVAMQKGYTGNVCDVCEGPNMVRNGTCERCQDCGATTGCS